MIKPSQLKKSVLKHSHFVSFDFHHRTAKFSFKNIPERQTRMHRHFDIDESSTMWVIKIYSVKSICSYLNGTSSCQIVKY